MGFERIAPVWDEEDNPAASGAPIRIRRLENPTHFFQGASIIVHMFQYFMRQDEIERSIREGEMFSRSTDHPAVFVVWRYVRSGLSPSGDLLS